MGTGYVAAALGDDAALAAVAAAAPPSAPLPASMDVDDSYVDVVLQQLSMPQLQEEGLEALETLEALEGAVV
jgi:hypothetical protein